jgi:hypothetical protein
MTGVRNLLATLAISTLLWRRQQTPYLIVIHCVHSLPVSQSLTLNLNRRFYTARSSRSYLRCKSASGSYWANSRHSKSHFDCDLCVFGDLKSKIETHDDPYSKSSSDHDFGTHLEPNAVPSSSRPTHVSNVNSIFEDKENMGFRPQNPLSRSALYRDLSLVGKTVAALIEIAIASTTDFISGFCFGYGAGVITGLPSLIFGSSTNGPPPVNRVPQMMPQAIMNEIQCRVNHMHGKSYRWAKEWGQISAIFTASRVSIELLRQFGPGSNAHLAENDDWTAILSSMTAGALLARSKGPSAMIQNALLYGGFTYMLSSNGPLARPRRSHVVGKRQIVDHRRIAIA